MPRIRAVFLASVISAVLSATAAADNLLEVYQRAAENDPQLRQAEAAYQAVKEGGNQARARLLPQLAATANLSRERQEIENSDSPLFQPGTFNSTTKRYNLSLNQAVYRRDYFVNLRQADAATGQALANYDAEWQNLVVRTADLYLKVLAAADDLDFARAEKNANQRLLEQTKQRFDVGLIAITDVHESQAAHDLAVAREIAAETRLAISKEELRETTGYSPAVLTTLRETIPLLTPEPADMNVWLESAGKQNLQFIAAQFAVDAAREEVELRRAGHYPTLDAVASYGYSDVGAGRFGGSETYDSSIGLQLRVPFYEGGGTQSRVREGQYRLTQAKEALEQQRRAVDRQTRSAYLNVLDNISSVNALKQARISSESALEATEAGYEVGTRTIVDVVQSRRNLFDAQRNYARVRYDYILSTLRLRQAAGLLEVEDLEEINRWLN
ncbi:MAG: TolC family outer membrane protein [Pseudomonadota bacterium]